jgi:DASH complex subunit DAD3
MAPQDIYTTEYDKVAGLEPLEARILTQYQLLATQLKTLANEVKLINTTASETRSSDDSGASDGPGTADQLLDNLRSLEMKIGLVYTLFRGAVYSLFLQHEEDENLKIDKAKEDEENDNAASDLQSG